MALKVMVNADDLGISDHVNSEVFRLIDAGRVTSATLIANAPAIEHAALRTRSFPEISFGAHLNITEFKPLTGARALAPLVDANGNFSGRIRQFKIAGELKHAIRAEWNEQIARLRALGIDVSHIDSHHHVHTIPSLFGTLKAVQRDSGIRRVRITKNVYANSERPSVALLAKKTIWNFALRRYLSTGTTDAFTDFGTMNGEVSPDIPPGRTIELMVHPGNPGSAEETAALEQEWWRRFNYATELISYRHL